MRARIMVSEDKESHVDHRRAGSDSPNGTESALMSDTGENDTADNSAEQIEDNTEYQSAQIQMNSGVEESFDSAVEEDIDPAGAHEDDFVQGDEVIEDGVQLHDVPEKEHENGDVSNIQISDTGILDEIDDASSKSSQEYAAVKIQAVQRGIRDRSKVTELKSKKELPAQKRATQPKPLILRESVKSHGEIKFYDGIGCSYVGDLLDGLPHGTGRYTFSNGTVYEGEFAHGQFEGKGHYIFEGIGKVAATFKDGRAMGEELTFDDGLQYQPQGWKYCVEGDRRFYHEVVDPRFGLTD